MLILGYLFTLRAQSSPFDTNALLQTSWAGENEWDPSVDTCGWRGIRCEQGRAVSM